MSTTHQANKPPEWTQWGDDKTNPKLKEYIELGVTNFMFWFLDSPSLDGARIFNQQVIPELRRMYD